MNLLEYDSHQITSLTVDGLRYSKEKGNSHTGKHILQFFESSIEMKHTQNNDKKTTEFLTFSTAIFFSLTNEYTTQMSSLIG